MNEVLLFLHFIGFIITIGAAIYDRYYIARNIRLARGSALERELIRIYLSTSPLYATAAALILFSGIGLTILHGEGFFKLSAVGLKQSLFLAIGLTFPVYIIPLMLKINQILNTLPETTRVPEKCRFLLGRLYLILDIITIVAILILAISIWKPDLRLIFRWLKF